MRLKLGHHHINWEQVRLVEFDEPKDPETQKPKAWVYFSGVEAPLKLTGGEAAALWAHIQMDGVDGNTTVVR